MTTPSSDPRPVHTGTTQARLRDLPSRVVIYLLLAGCLFGEVGYLGVWRKLTGALAGLPTATPTPAALAQARHRVGAAPLRWLFDLLRGPAAGRQRGTRWRGLLVCAVDGTTLTVPDSPAVLARFTKQEAGHHGGTGYPQLRLLALVACGTRTLIDAVFGPTTIGETSYAPALLRSLRPGMIVLADRNFGAKDLIADIAATGADVLVRLKNGRRMPVLARYPDGSYLSMLGPLRVRVVEAEITIATTAGRHTGQYRLATTLHDPHRYPAAELIRLYHERWEIETAYLELKSSILGGRILRARTPTGVEQEVYALLITYQLLRTAIADATHADTDPDRASFTTALHTARDLLIQATGVIADTVIDLVGTIGRHVLDHLMPDRRLRVSPRIVKRAISKYQARGPNIDRASYKATINIDILTGEPP
ncbi:IS4 family transposase [Jiangella muralis]|uniref:IS4 family transposase n=1 Tax=Jiangella muralis TaxID=702383 RepID=UPI00069F2E11